MIALRIRNRIEIPEDKMDKFCFRHRIGRNAAKIMIKKKCSEEVDEILKGMIL